MTREERILAIVFAPGTSIYPSKLNRRPQLTVVVNGLTGKDACERDAERCFDVLLEEEDGGHEPGRLAFGMSVAGPTLRLTGSDHV